MMNNMIEIEREQAIGQSRLLKNSSQMTRAIVSVSGLPSNSGMTNSPIDAEKTNTQPEMTPAIENGIVIFQNAFVGWHPRSCAASRHDLSILFRTEYIGNIMNGV
ncbi:hypothetical protein FACS1894113_5600 [Alphaproteobacteria bacterium]|nr:hypothetical protein FACS1894113_5600 [Alphaproteobacteria bacterium]